MAKNRNIFAIFARQIAFGYLIAIVWLCNKPGQQIWMDTPAAMRGLTMKQ
jgi:hypothetical protein